MTKPPQIISADDFVLTNGINMMVYGYPGCGKTPFIASGGKGTLIIDGDEGSWSATGSGCEVWPKCTTWDAMDEVYEYLRHNPNAYKWVWWDGISIGQDKLLEDIMVELIKPEAQGGKGKSHRKPYLIDRGEFQENFMRMKQWVRHMIALPFNFGITGHPSPSYDVATEEEKLWPWVQGRNMPQQISANFDIIAFAKRDDGKFKLYVEESEEFYARDRSGALGAGLVSPTIPAIERRIVEKWGSKKSAAKAAPARKAAPVAKKAAAPKPGPRPVPKKVK